MLTILTERYPNFDWETLHMLPIVYMSGSGNYRVIEELWPTDIYPTIPSSDDIKGWLE